MFRRLKATARWLGFRAFPGALILRYHRVADLSADPHATAVTPEHFAEHLQVLRARFRPLSLRSLVRSLEHEGPPRLGVVVTFDDGYADNLYQAKPLLEQFDIPATVFVTTGQIGADREFWWDELEKAILRPGTLPRTLALEADGRSFRADLGENATYGDSEFERDRGWSWRADRDPTSRQTLFRRLLRYLSGLDPDWRAAVMESFRDWAGDRPSVRASHAVLSAEELRTLADGGLVEVGAHTVSHPRLSSLPADAQQDEIRDSKAFLEGAIGEAVTSFAYPYGDVGGAAGRVRDAGFEAACTTRSGVVFRNRDPFQLPRVYAGDWDGVEFERRLRTLP